MAELSELWSALVGSLGVVVRLTTAYHPQANGLYEQFHQSHKSALCTVLSYCYQVDCLPWVMLRLRSAPKEDLSLSWFSVTRSTSLGNSCLGALLLDPIQLSVFFGPPAVGIQAQFTTVFHVCSCLQSSCRHVLFSYDMMLTARPFKPPYDCSFQIIKMGATLSYVSHPPNSFARLRLLCFS